MLNTLSVLHTLEMTRRLFWILLLFAVASLSIWSQFAQRGGVRRSVFDTSGAVVPGAQVTMLNIDMADIHLQPKG